MKYTVQSFNKMTASKYVSKKQESGLAPDFTLKREEAREFSKEAAEEYVKRFPQLDLLIVPEKEAPEE